MNCFSSQNGYLLLNYLHFLFWLTQKSWPIFEEQRIEYDQEMVQNYVACCYWVKVSQYLVGILNNQNILTLNASTSSSLLLSWASSHGSAPEGRSKWTSTFQTSTYVMLVDFPLAQFSYLSKPQTWVGADYLSWWIPKRHDSWGRVGLIQYYIRE